MDGTPQTPHKEFVSEPITPVAGSFDTASMAAGEPGMPGRFVWRDTEYEVDRVLEAWKTTGPCTHGSREQYVRRHWFRIVTTSGAEMEIYFDRQARVRQKSLRWWLATVIEPEQAPLA
jgi:hypothetical protein